MAGMAIAVLTTGALIYNLFASYNITPALGFGWIMAYALHLLRAVTSPPELDHPSV